MEKILQLFIFLPLVGFVASLLINGDREKIISRIAFYTVGLHLVSAFIFVGYWLIVGFPTLNLKETVLFHTSGYEFFIDFCFDKITAVYLLVGAFLTFLVAVYSQYYMHREAGYKRFFNTILFFYVGYNLVIFSGNLETLFIGWEVLGISSFLLIAFYRNRYLPVKNALKVFSVYRISDVGLLLAMWMSHHFWHENITFLKLSNYDLVHTQLQTHSLIGVFISLMILLSAATKSAQLPFSSWLPRAMEGPTPSSAIFYGSLSVHLGVFLLLRTYTFWEHQVSVRMIIAVLGLLTALVATGIARVQSSVKSQIAYSSVAQIGLIFIEVAAGFENLALFHFAANAFLRTYQLLISPSVVSYLIREQFYNFVPRQHTVEDSLPKKIEYTFYMLCLKEWNLDAFMYRYLWNPLKWAGHRLGFVTVNSAFIFTLPIFIIGLIILSMEKLIPSGLYHVLPIVFSILGLMTVLRSFTERKNVKMSMFLVMITHFWIALAISFNEHFDYSHTILYLSGIVVSGILGYVILLWIEGKEKGLDLNQFHGLSFEYPKTAFLFLMACLGLAGFPITPTFVGEDLIFSHIHEDQWLLAFLAALCFILNGLAIIRIYSRVFMGPYSKARDRMAYRSS